MSQKPTSLEEYYKQRKKFQQKFPGTPKPELQDIDHLFELMKHELIVYGYSPLLDTAFQALYRFLQHNRMLSPINSPYYYGLHQPNGDIDMPVITASYCMGYLSSYIEEKNTIKKIPPEEFYININRRFNIKTNFIRDAVKEIDHSILMYREKLYGNVTIIKSNSEVSNKGGDAASRLSFEQPDVSNNGKDTASHPSCEQSDVEIKRSYYTAVQEAQEMKDAIINSATQEAELIKKNAQEKSDYMLAEIQQRNLSMRTQERLKFFSEQNELLKTNIEDFRRKLYQANEEINSLSNGIENIEHVVTEMTITKIFPQFSELYNLIADLKDTVSSLLQQSDDPNLKNEQNNLEIFMEMIEEYLSEYGIQTIYTMPGENFSAKYHEIFTKDFDYDPFHSEIKISLRNGFIQGDRVLQKERVEIKQ